MIINVAFGPLERVCMEQAKIGVVSTLSDGLMKVEIYLEGGRLYVFKSVHPSYSPVCVEYPTAEQAFRGLFPFEVVNMFQYHGMMLVLDEAKVEQAVEDALQAGSLRDENDLLAGEVKLLTSDNGVPLWEPAWDYCDDDYGKIDVDRLYETVESGSEPEPVKIPYRRVSITGAGHKRRSLKKALESAPWAKSLTEEDWAFPKDELRKRLRQGVEVFHEDFLEALKHLKESVL